MKSNCRKRIFCDAPGLHRGGHILLTEPINSLVQEIWGDPKPCQDNDSPDSPGGSGLGVTDVGEPVDRGGGEKFIHLSPEAPHGELSSESIVEYEGSGHEMFGWCDIDGISTQKFLMSSFKMTFWKKNMFQASYAYVCYVYKCHTMTQ